MSEIKNGRLGLYYFLG